MIFKNKDKIFRANSFSENFNDKILNFQSRGEITFVNLVSKQREQVAGWLGLNMTPHNMSSQSQPAIINTKLN